MSKRRYPRLPREYKWIRKPNAPLVESGTQNLINTYINMLKTPPGGAMPAIYIPQHIKDYVAKYYMRLPVKPSIPPMLPIPRPMPPRPRPPIGQPFPNPVLPRPKPKPMPPRVPRYTPILGPPVKKLPRPRFIPIKPSPEPIVTEKPKDTEKVKKVIIRKIKKDVLQKVREGQLKEIKGKPMPMLLHKYRGAKR